MLPAVSPLDEKDFVADLPQGVRVESEPTVERRRVEPASGCQERSVLEALRSLDALAENETHRIRLRGDVAGIALEGSPEFRNEPG